MPVLGGAVAAVASPVTAAYAPVVEVPVIGMHAENPTTVVKTILRRGFTPVWVSDLISAIEGKSTLPPQAMCLILDDGADTWFSTSHGVFQAYGVKATLAVTSNYLYNTSYNSALNTNPPMTWDNARTMHASGLYDWQNHGQTHGATPNDAELIACNQAIVNELGVATPRAVIYPFGSYTAASAAAAKALGFVLGFTYGDGTNRPPRPNVIPGNGLLILQRENDSAKPLRWAKQVMLYESANDMTGGRNAANTLGYWTFSHADAALASAGEAISITSVSTQAAKTATSTDYFHVDSGRLYSYAELASTGQSAGNARLSIRQYDKDLTELTRLDLATLTASQASTGLPSDTDLASNCRFVRLEAAVDATYNGTFEVRHWTVRARS